MNTPSPVGPGEVLLIGIACIVAVMPMAAAFGAWLRHKRRAALNAEARRSKGAKRGQG
jgi:uncharacterized iron-regulated membrane protein